MYQNDPLKVLTGEVRLSYCNLSVPKAPANNPNAEPKYSVTLLIPKSDFATKADIDNAIEAAAKAAQSSVWGGVRPPIIKSVVHDGDGVRQSGVAFGPECKGHWVITASTKMKPQVVGIDNINCELDPRDVYSGMYARVTLRFYGYLNSGNKGVGCGLGNVMKTRDGEPLAGGASAASDFAGIGQAAVQPQGYTAAPVMPQQNMVAPTMPQGQAINPITGLPM